MSQLQWKSISLTGFGPFSPGIKVEFHDGLNTLIAPNEAGKSTLMNGLLAVIFGLPTSNEPGKFGTSRFRSWSGMDSFFGEVVFTVGGKTYRIRRQFTDHRVEISQFQDERWQEINAYQHNPRSTRVVPHYQNFLQNQLGMNNSETFAAIFYLEQPLPEKNKISGDIQSLLSGSGGNFKQALEQLGHELGKITKYVSEYGSGTDKRNDRELEITEKRIQELEQLISHGKNSIDELQGVLLELEELNKEIMETRQALKTKKHLQEAWGTARRLYQQYEAALNKQLELKDAYRRVEQLETDQRQIEQKLEREYGIFTTEETPHNFLEILDGLINGRKETEALEDALIQLGDDLAKEKERAETINASLAELKAFQDNPHLLADWQQWRNLAQRKAKLKTELGDYEDKIKTVDSTIDEEYRVFANITSAQQEELEEYGLQKFRLENQLQEGKDRWQAAQDEKERYEEAKNKFQSELNQLGQVSVEDLEHKIHYLDELQQIKESINMKTPTGLSPNKSILIGSGLVLFASLGWVFKALPGALLGALLGVLIGWGLSGLVRGAGREVSALKARKVEIEKQLTMIDQRLEPNYHHLNQAELGALLEKRRSLAYRGEELKNWEERITALNIQELDKARLEAENQLIQWQSLLKEQLEVFGENLPQAYKEYQELRTRRRGYEDKMAELLAAEGDAPTKLIYFQQEMAQLAPKVGPYTLDTNEKTVAEDAERFQNLREEWRGSQSTLTSINNEIKRLEQKRNDLIEEITNITQQYQTLLAPWEMDSHKTKTAWQTYQQEKQKLRELKGQLAGLLTGVQAQDRQELAKNMLAVENEAQMLLTQLTELAAKHPGLPAFTSTQDRQALEGDFLKLTEEIHQLESREEELRAKERELGRKQASLEGKESFNLAQGELILTELQEQKEAWEFEAQALGIAQQELDIAIQEYSISHRSRLEEQVTQYFQKFTQEPRDIIITEDFNLQVLEDGRMRYVNQFSQGTRDQIFLALRLAIGDLLAGVIRLPFIFDDPFLNCDAHRLKEIKRTLQHLAQERQIILLSHREDLANWGKRIPITMNKG